MYLTPERLAELRELVETESMSWGDAADLQGAFEQIDPATLPEPAENAGWGDMLDELEARLPRPHVTFYASADIDTADGTWSVYREAYPSIESYEPIPGSGAWVSRHDTEAEADAEAARLYELERQAYNVAHHEPTD